MSEVSVDVQHRRIMTNRANSDDAVDAGPEGDCRATGVAVQLDCFLEYVSRQRFSSIGMSANAAAAM